MDKREQLAALAHEQWSGWMEYMFSKSVHNADGSVTIPAELVSRWARQMNTPYEQLPEQEKESDRVEADKVIRLLEE
jgi:hypothetical protein